MCSHQHDKIFGTLSLVQHDPMHEKIEISYKMSLEELFLRTLACWTMGRVTVKLGHQLQLLLNLDYETIFLEAKARQSLFVSSVAASTTPSIVFLAIRLGTIAQIESTSSVLVFADGLPTLSMVFDGLYSDRLNIIGKDCLQNVSIVLLAFPTSSLASGTSFLHS
jgi:hypothetical protein